ncbi:MAG: hypothetical protein JO180_00525 [Gemmatirosa sp.]|nr:hypothetical protein [Gemmatirosa sp.]
MTEPMHARPGDAGFRGVQRRLADLLGAADLTGATGPSLEAMRLAATEPPRLRAAPVIEGHALRARRVDGAPTPGFAAFLDGTQASHVVCYYDGMPIVFGSVAAVVRMRRNRRHVTWPRGPLVERRLYAPLAYLPAGVHDALRAEPLDVVDTTAPDESGERPIAHPLMLLDRAVHFVQADRERAERDLAEAWCRGDGGNLFVDGGLQGSEIVAAAPCVVGVVKSHRTLYADGDALRLVLALGTGQRSSVIRIAAPRRAPVASWYLRLRDPAGHDPMWGLVRVEAADRAVTESPEQLAARADAISRWILAETAPLALPDGRWDKMVYGIRDCEQFLAAVC